MRPTTPLAILDSGAGTGYYLRHVLTHSPIAHDPLASDASAAAVSMTIAATGAAGLVADVWQPSPVRSARADVVLCIFAPRNPSEFARVLRDDGTLVVVTPANDHLTELRTAGVIMGMHDDKLASLDSSLDSLFTLTSRERVHYRMELSSADASDLSAMGPSGHHEPAGSWPGGSVTVSVDCSAFSVRSVRGSTRTASR